MSFFYVEIYIFEKRAKLNDSQNSYYTLKSFDSQTSTLKNKVIVIPLAVLGMIFKQKLDKKNKAKKEAKVQ